VPTTKKRKLEKPTEPVRMLVADEQGWIYDHPELLLAGERGAGPEPIGVEELIPLPRGSDLFGCPGRHPIGFDPGTGKPAVMREFEGGEARTVAVFLAPAHTSCHNAAWERATESPMLPTYAYTAVGMADDQYWASAVRVDPDPRQDPWRFSLKKVKHAVASRMRDLSRNRVAQQLERCAVEYGCRAAQNYFLNRHEAPLPVSVACNAQCIGCISLQPDGEFKASHDRLDVSPTPEEVAEIALGHIERVPDAVVSFGQGCEGEPLLLGDVLEGAIERIRAKTSAGTINLNTNGSKPEVVRRLCNAGLDAMRVSLNSPRPDLYEAYFQPRGYGVGELVESLRIVKAAGGHTAINLLCFPGVTDTEPELDAVSQLAGGVSLDMIQMRNLNIDPDLYREALPQGTASHGRGMRWFMAELTERHEGLGFGYFNPSFSRAP